MKTPTLLPSTLVPTVTSPRRHLNFTPYDLKPWWPRDTEAASPTAPAEKPDPFTVFRQQVAREARRLGLPVCVQDYVLLSLDGFDVGTLRPDVIRQAREWVAQHKKLPRPLRLSHIRPISTKSLSAQARPCQRQPRPATLAREALVTRLIEVERLPFKQVARQLGVFPEIVRQIHARARRRQRENRTTITPVNVLRTTPLVSRIHQIVPNSRPAMLTHLIAESVNNFSEKLID